MLAGVLNEVGVVVVVLLLHETFLDDNREDVRDNSDRYEYERVQVQLSVHVIALHYILVSRPNHVTVLQCNQCQTTSSK